MKCVVCGKELGFLRTLQLLVAMNIVSRLTGEKEFLPVCSEECGEKIVDKGD